MENYRCRVEGTFHFDVGAHRINSAAKTPLFLLYSIFSLSHPSPLPRHTFITVTIDHN